MKENYLRRARRGMRLMTAKKGKGWVDSFDLDTFDVTKPWDFVVGQNYGGQSGNYLDGMEDLFGRGLHYFDLAMDYGFELPRTASAADWARLQTVWVNLIKQARQP